MLFFSSGPVVRFILFLLMTIVLTACGGGGGGLPGKKPYSVGGSVSGLVDDTVTLQNNGTNDTVIVADGSFTFSKTIPDGSRYAVTVKNQPSNPNLLCAVNNGSGQLSGGAVSNVNVICADTSTNQTTFEFYALGGVVSGLSGTLVLQNIDDSELTINQSGGFVFTSSILNGSSYQVTVKSQPEGQLCSIARGAGTISGANVTDVTVSCVDEEPNVNTYKVTGVVNGLKGSGLVLQNVGSVDLPIASNGTFSFTENYFSGSSYQVTIKNQPSALNQICTVTNGQGTIAQANINNISINCINENYTLSGSTKGLFGSGLQVRNANGESVNISQNGDFSFGVKLADGSDYAVSISNQPTNPEQICSIENGVGRVAGADVSDVTITCATNTYTIAGSVSGLVGSGLQLGSSSGEVLSVNTNGAFLFSQGLADGSSYKILIKSEPLAPSQTCTVTNGVGSLSGANVTDVAVDCVTNKFKVGATVTGLKGQLVVQNNGADNVTLSATGANVKFNFPTALADMNTYEVSVLSSPSSPKQTCQVVNNASGTLAGEDIDNIEIACETELFTVGGSVTGLTGQLVLQNNAGDNLTLNNDGTALPFTFATPLADLSSYAVTVLTSPTSPQQSCNVTANGSGVLAGANVSDIQIVCTSAKFSVGGSVTGLTGQLVLQNRGEDNLTLTGDGTALSFTFATPLADLSSYAVTVLTSPTSPKQSCSVTANGSGSLAGANVNNIQVVCTSVKFSIGGAVTGLNGRVVLQNKGGDNLTLTGDGTALSFTFATPLADLSSYAVTVLTQPTLPNQTCVVNNGTGSLSGSNITNISVLCATNVYSVSGSVSGLVGTGLVLQNNGGDDLPIATNGDFTFKTSLVDGSNFAVSVAKNPKDQICTSSNHSGVINGKNIFDVVVNCIVGVKVQASVQPVAIPFGSTSPIVITFNESMDISSFIIEGSLAKQSDGGTWSKNKFANDTLTLRPGTSWQVKPGASLTVQAKGLSANSLMSIFNPYGTIYFVSHLVADDSGDGLTEATAKHTIKGAIDVASVPAVVVVNTGTYLVNSDTTGAPSHVVLKEGVSLSGGYSANFSVRNPTIYPSIITDMSSEDKTGFGAVPPNSAVESRAGVTTKTVVDGFTVNGSTQSGVEYAAAIFISGGAPTIQNNILNGGVGRISSTVMNIRGSSTPVIKNNKISGVSSSSYGIITTTSASIQSNTISGMFAIWNGGGSSPNIFNNLIYATSYGIINNDADPRITNNTLYGNGVAGNGIYNQLDSIPVIENNIISSFITCLREDNVSADPGSIRNNNLYGCMIVYYDMDAGCTGNGDGDSSDFTCTLNEMEALADFATNSASGNVSLDPLFTDLDGADNNIATMGDNDWRLQTASPVNVREGGLNLSGSYVTDRNGNARTAIINGAPSNSGAKGWSMGAHERD